MNKSKLISVAVLCALALSACVDDKESTSVTALREAKTSYLKAQADYQTAQAEAAKINAEVAKAKAESEIKLAELQAKADAAKTDAETEAIKQEMQQEADRFAAELAGIEAKAKADAAYYEAAYQEYLNELAAAQRQAVKEQQSDLVGVIDNYKVALGNIRTQETNVRNFTKQLAQKQQEKTEIMAGKALALAKNAVLEQEAKLSGLNIRLNEWKTFAEADANAQKEMIEGLRAGLPEKADALKAAVDKVTAIEEQAGKIRDEIEALNVILNGYDQAIMGQGSIPVAGKLDTLITAWEELNVAEYARHGENIFQGTLETVAEVQAIKYYDWEADKLIKDLESDLAGLRADSLRIDTLEVVAAKLKPLFATLEKAIAANDKAVADYETKTTAREAAEAELTELEQSGVTTGTKHDEAVLKVNKAIEAEATAKNVVEGYEKDNKHIDGTSELKTAAEEAYTTKRDANHALETEVAGIKENIIDALAKVSEVKAAKAICFGTLPSEIAKLAEQISEKQMELDAIYDPAVALEALKLAEAYEADREMVEDWDNAIKNGTGDLAIVEKKINTLEGKVATAEARLQNLKDILEDPDQIDTNYCEAINEEIKDIEDQLDEAQRTLDAEKVKVNAYKATIDAWTVGAAE